jgi:two-component system, NarL family, response regulator NreC
VAIRVLLCDDHTLMRQGLRLLLGQAGGIQVVGEAANGLEAIEAVDRLRPDVALLDITMPELDGLEATRVIRRRAPTVKVLILTMHDDPACVFQAIDAGASGYLLKDSSAIELGDAIRSVDRARTFVALGVTGAVAAEYLAIHGQGPATPTIERLTAREEEVLRLLADGCTNQEIADRFSLSVKTVETHRSHILQKLNVRKRAELQRWFRTHSLRRSGGCALSSLTQVGN